MFSVAPAIKHMCGEASSIGFPAGVCPAKALYDDACDVGIEMFNPRTGVMTRWYMQDEVRDNDNDITHWTFRATSETLRKHPQLKDWRVDILND
jgi:hypothetical protein